MALTGIHVACCFAGAPGKRGAILPAIYSPEWSETMDEEGTTSNAAPDGSQETGSPLFAVSAGTEVFIAVGPDPDPATVSRLYLSAGQDLAICCNAGDKLAWIAA